MKNFKSFVQIDELMGVAPKAKKEHDFVHATYMAQVKDPGDLEKVGPEEEGPKTIKSGQGKRPADRLDNKQAFGEQDMKHPEDEKTSANKLQKFGTKKWLTKDYKNGKVTKEEVEQVDEISLGLAKRARDKAEYSVDMDYDDMRDKPYGHSEKQRSKFQRYIDKKEPRAKGDRDWDPPVKKEEVEQVDEADFTKQQTKMAHTIGKEFEKKGVGDKAKGGPFAVASAMVRDKPEAAAKAYKTIKAKMKNEDHQDALMALYDELNEANQKMFMNLLESDPEKLLDFALNKHKE